MVMLSKSPKPPRLGIYCSMNFFVESGDRSILSFFLDDDLILKSVERMLIAIQIQEENCDFVSCAFSGLSFIDDVRPHEQKIGFGT